MALVVAAKVSETEMTQMIVSTRPAQFLLPTTVRLAT
jgi:hypothetical protein